MNAAKLFVEALEREGVEYIFGIPGEENLDLLEAIRTSSIKLIITRHEQAAGFMAATYGRLTGKTGVCLSTLGPGATNFLTAAAYAQLGAMPMLMITGQKPIRSSKQGHFQIIDMIEVMKPVTKFTKQIVDGRQIPSLVREAFKTAEAERPGAVHLEFPEDVARDEVSEPRFLPIQEVRRPIAEEKAIQSAIQMIQEATSPLVLIGAGANRKRIHNTLQTFLEKTKIPFVNTQMGKGVGGTLHELFIGTTALSDKDYVHCAIKKADLIINIGHDVIEKPPFFMEPTGSKVIHVNFFPAKVDHIYFPQLEVVGDIGNALWQLSEGITPQTHWDFSYFHKTRTYLEEHIARDAKDPRFPLIPQRIVADTREILPKESILCLDNGMYKLWFARNYQTFAPNTLLLDNALATMGAGFPSAMAAKLVHPEKPVVSIVGDGGFMMNSQELETAVRLKLPIVTVILNDSAYGMIKWKQEGMELENYGLDFGNPDFVKYAESYGAKGIRINSTDEYKKVLKEALQHDGPVIIDLPIDYSENHKVLTEELAKNTCHL